MDLNALKKSAKTASNLLKVMSNEWRLLILCHLASGDESVGELEKKIIT